jgi:tRNA uridine 5-carboxymethylaminomethyl modification enzyme
VEVGCVSDKRKIAFERKLGKIESLRATLSGIQFTARQIASQGVNLSVDGPKRTALDALSLTDFDFPQIESLLATAISEPKEIRSQVKNDALYANYIARQAKDIAAMARDEVLKIPVNYDFNDIKGLSNELLQKLQRVQPRDVGQAGRIDGMTPAGLMLLVAGLKRESQAQKATG